MASTELTEIKPLIKENSGLPGQNANNQSQGQTDAAQPVAGSSWAEGSTARANRSSSSDRGSGTQVPQVILKKKICVKFLPSRRSLKEVENIIHLTPNFSLENIRCKCGLRYKDHDQDKVKCHEDVKKLLDKNKTVEEFIRDVYKEGHGNEQLQRKYRRTPKTDDAMKEVEGTEIGRIDFRIGQSRTLSSRFARISDETEMFDLKPFLRDTWNLLEAEPELIISVIGTTTNIALADRLADEILKISRYVNVIILTSGLENDMVAKKIGDAITKEQRWTTEGDKQSKAKIKCVGITSWGAMKRKPEEDGSGKFIIRASDNSPIQSLVLNPGHSYFLLVDNGTTEDMPYDLNTFWVNLQKCLQSLKKDSLRVMNLILGNKKNPEKHLDMVNECLRQGLPLILLQHSEKCVDVLIEGVLHVQIEENLDIDSVISHLKTIDKDKPVPDEIKTFLKDQVINDAHGQKKNVITVCDLLNEGSSNPEVGNKLDSVMLRTTTKPALVKARVNGREPNHESVLQILSLAVDWRCWDLSMDQLLQYKYEWTDNEMKRLKGICKKCLCQDLCSYIPIFNQDGWIPMEKNLSFEMLVELYKETQLVNDPLRAVYKRKNIKDKKDLEELVHKLMLPDSYLPEKGKPYHKDLLMWAVLSKKWNIVKYILDMCSQKEAILVWVLATAYLCKAVALGQLDVQIRNEYKKKQREYEMQGLKLIEELGIKHGNTSSEDHSNAQSRPDSAGHSEVSYPHLSLETPSEAWGSLCPADFALLGNFKTFVKSEAFHNYTVKKWKSRCEDPACCLSCPPRVKFYTHWTFYMIMVCGFCAAIVSGVQIGHFAHQIWMLFWICCYLIGEVFTRRQQQKTVKFCSKKKQILLFVKTYLHLLLLFLFLIGGFVCSISGAAHWGGMLYGLACLILITCVCGHFLSLFHLFAPQLAIAKKAIKEIVTFMIMIMLLVWSVTMIFHSVLCLDANSLAAYTSKANKTWTNEIASGGWANTLHTAFFLYLSLYGEYNFELNENGHLSCVADQKALIYVSYFLIGLHILIGNVLFMSLLVSVIGTKAGDLQSDLVYVWKSNWFRLTLHYGKQTILPPPFNIGELIFRLVYFHIRKCRDNRQGDDDQTDMRMHPSPTSQNLQLYEKEAFQAISARQ